jgi:hypothetical protein
MASAVTTRTRSSQILSSPADAGVNGSWPCGLSAATDPANDATRRPRISSNYSQESGYDGVTHGFMLRRRWKRPAFSSMLPAEVWEDIGNWPTWAPTVTSVTTTAADLVVGTTAELKQPKIPTSIWTVTSVEPERGFTWSIPSNGVVTTAEHELHPMDSGTEAVLRITHRASMGRPMLH